MQVGGLHGIFLAGARIDSAMHSCRWVARIDAVPAEGYEMHFCLGSGPAGDSTRVWDSNKGKGQGTGQQQMSSCVF